MIIIIIIILFIYLFIFLFKYRNYQEAPWNVTLKFNAGCQYGGWPFWVAKFIACKLEFRFRIRLFNGNLTPCPMQVSGFLNNLWQMPGWLMRRLLLVSDFCTEFLNYVLAFDGNLWSCYLLMTIHFYYFIFCTCLLFVKL